MWLAIQGAETPDAGTIRADLLSSITISWSCKSSVMEMTKNRMIKAQLIATTFRQLLVGRPGQAAAWDRLLHSNPIPTIATQTQTRFSAISMVFKISYAIHSSGAIAFHLDWPINYALARKSRAASVKSKRMNECEKAHFSADFAVFWRRIVRGECHGKRKGLRQDSGSRHSSCDSHIFG